MKNTNGVYNRLRTACFELVQVMAIFRVEEKSDVGSNLEIGTQPDRWVKIHPKMGMFDHDLANWTGLQAEFIACECR